MKFYVLEKNRGTSTVDIDKFFVTET